MQKFFRLYQDQDIDIRAVQHVVDYDFGEYSDSHWICGRRIPLPLPPSLHVWVSRGKKPDVLLNPQSWLIVSTRLLSLIEKHASGSLQAIELPLTRLDGRGLVRGYWLVNTLGRIAAKAGDENDWNALDPRKIPHGVHFFQLHELSSAFFASEEFVEACQKARLSGIDWTRAKLVEGGKGAHAATRRWPATSKRQAAGPVRQRCPLPSQASPAPPYLPEISDEFDELIAKRRLQPSIKMLEKSLRSVKRTPYHVLLGRDFLHLTESLAAFLIEFCRACAAERLKLAAIYGEMNEFCVNTKQWHCDLFGFGRIGKGLDWLADPQEVAGPFELCGMEPVQRAFGKCFRKKTATPHEAFAAEIATCLVTARFMELFAAASKLAQGANAAARRLLLLAAVHDSDTIWRSR